MNKQIPVQIKRVYGNRTIYPVDDQGQFFCNLAGTKSFTTLMIKLLKEQGYSFEVINQEIV